MVVRNDDGGAYYCYVETGCEMARAGCVWDAETMAKPASV